MKFSIYALSVTAVPITIWLISKYPEFGSSKPSPTIEDTPSSSKDSEKIIITLPDYRAGGRVSESVDEIGIALRTVAAEASTLVSTVSAGIIIPFLKTLLKNLGESYEIEKKENDSRPE